MSHGISCLTGGAGAETVVFLHGIGGDARSFHNQMDAFDGVRTVAWNMPGYGASDVRQSPPDFTHLSERLADVIDELGGPVHLVGHSIGGMIALDHALRRPDQVDSLCLVASTPRFGGRDNSFADAFLAARLGPLDRGQSMARMAKGAVPHLVAPETPADEMTLIETCMAEVPEATWRDILRCLVTFDRADDLAAVSCPVLAVAGEVDGNAPPKTMKKMAARIPEARYVVFPRTGHFPHQERAPEFNAALADFLNTKVIQ